MLQRTLMRYRLLAVLLLLLGSVSVVFGQDSGTNAIPPEVSKNAQQWALANFDYANTRNTTAAQIDSSNVNQLGVAWAFPIPDVSSFGALATNPIVENGVVYFETLTSHIYALNLSDGSVIWDHDYASENIGPNGVAVAWGKVFALDGEKTVAALDASTGKELWTQDLPLTDSEGLDIQPTPYNDIVYVASVPGVGVSNFYSGNGQGKVFALNQQTGEIVWSFNTVKGDNIWGNQDVNSGGGSWYPPAIDTSTGMTYWSSANPAPWPGTTDFPNGSSRPGPNLYSNSLLALSGDTGELSWYTQVKPHDLFDLDLQLSPILAPVTIDGTQHNAVFTSGKLGTVYAMDQDTGALLWSTDVGQHENDHVLGIPDGKTIRVLPGDLGGVETPMAYADGTIYVPLLNQPTYYTSTAIGTSNEKYPVTGQLLAIDANTGAILWSNTFDSPDYGAATVANDLVFTSTYDGTLYAFDRATGDQVWSWKSPSGTNGFPAIVDDTILLPAGVGQAPQLIALRLGATGAAITPPPATPETTAAPSSDAAAAPMATATPSADAAATPAATVDMNMAATPEATPETTPQATAEAQSSDPMSQYLSVDQANQTVTLQIIAGMTDANGGMNFNGRDHGGATITVPEGWTVQVDFSNQGLLPHSAMIVATDVLSQTTINDTVFDGAEIANPHNGVIPGNTAQFSFTAATQGEYAFACGVPGHAASGQWLHFNVGAPDVQPSFVTSQPTASGHSGV